MDVGEKTVAYVAAVGVEELEDIRGRQVGKGSDAGSAGRHRLLKS